MRWIGAGALLLLAGCADLQTAHGIITSGTPAVVGVDGADATLILIACPNRTGISQIQQFIQFLSAAGVIVSAKSGGIAKLEIDLCPRGV
jgi:hypothetical protein